MHIRTYGTQTSPIFQYDILPQARKLVDPWQGGYLAKLFFLQLSLAATLKKCLEALDLANWTWE